MLVFFITAVCLIGLLAMLFCFLGMRSDYRRGNRSPAVGCLAEREIRRDMRLQTRKKIMARYSAKIGRSTKSRLVNVFVLCLVFFLSSRSEAAQSAPSGAQILK